MQKKSCNVQFTILHLFVAPAAQFVVVALKVGRGVAVFAKAVAEIVLSNQHHLRKYLAVAGVVVVAKPPSHE